MPSQKSRSKEDTWTPDELNRALKTNDRRHKDKDEDRKRDRIKVEEKHRRRREEDTDRNRTRDDDDRRRRKRDEDDTDGPRLTEDDRERQRRERRERREKDSKPKKGEIQFRGKEEVRGIDLEEIDNGSQERHRRHKEDRDRRHKDRDDDRDRKYRDSDDRREKRHRNGEDHSDRRRRHHDVDEDEDDREKRRMERRKERESKEEEERRRRHEEKKDRRRQEEEKERRRQAEEKDRRSDRHKDRKDRDREKGRNRDEERDERRREKEREERRKEREERHKEKDDRKHRNKQEEEKQEEEEADDYNYEEDFEDYEEDFEEDNDDDADDNEQVAVNTKKLTVRSANESIHRKKRDGTELDYSDSEVSAVLKALDAENDRLIRESSRSPMVSNQYGHQRRDDDEDSDDRYEKTYQPRAERPRTAINFVSAKQRAMNQKTASKTMQRGSDLLKMLELDYISFDILDMPPVNEYDLYIRTFGGTNTRQAYVQTNDDNVDRELQTEEIDSRQKWTQHPPEDFAGCGRGDGEKDFEEEEESHSKQNKEQDTTRLNSFLEKAGQVIAILLEESKEDEGESMGRHKSQLAISEGYTELELLPILAGRHVVYSHFSPVQPNLLLTVYSQASDVSGDNPASKRGIICVWNTNEPTYPQKILACASQPHCCCFSPVKPSLVFAGMQDGSIAMWDLREAASIHRPTQIQDQSYALRYPTYDTAAVLSDENHHSPVTCISPIYSYMNSSKSGSSMTTQTSSASEDSTSGLSFQLVTTEETGLMHFWVVAELGTSDLSGSMNDLGLAPGGNVKLIKSSSLSPDSSNKDSRLKTGGIKALDMKLLPGDPNQYYIATDSGCVLHGVRFGKRAYPRAHSPVIESIVDVLSIDFSPFERPCFLVGCSDGSFSLYHTKSANPLITWPTVTKGKAVSCVRWSQSRPCVFYILDASSMLYVFDLLEGDMGPKYTEQISKDRVLTFTMTTDYKANGLGTPGKDPQILFGMETGKTEIHTVTKHLRTAEDLETDYLNSYLQRF